MVITGATGGLGYQTGLELQHQSDAQGWGILSATAREIEKGGYYGPDGFQERKGFPAPARISDRARDPLTAARLWAAAERLTGVAIPAL